jgi:hypothetical protein
MSVQVGLTGASLLAWGGSNARGAHTKASACAAPAATSVHLKRARDTTVGVYNAPKAGATATPTSTATALSRSTLRSSLHTKTAARITEMTDRYKLHVTRGTLSSSRFTETTDHYNQYDGSFRRAVVSV